MGEKLKIHEATTRILAGLKQQNYSKHAIDRYRQCYDGLIKYTRERRIKDYSTSIGLDFIKYKYGLSIEDFYSRQPKNVSSALRALQVLWDYLEYGRMSFKKRSSKKPFECPVQFTKEYEALKEICILRQYSPRTNTSILYGLQKFLTFLDDLKVDSSNEITGRHLIKFLSSYSRNSTTTIATTVSILRNYITFLYQENYMAADISGCLPKVRILRDAFIPSVWKDGDVKKLLDSIDRKNPKGKRDYAIILLVARLGLRVGDIRSLKMADLNWDRKLLSIVMQKTRRPLELPLIEDVGWAIIDYLKNGRPHSISKNIFIRHIAPYNGFSDGNSFDKMLAEYMNKAGIVMRGQKHGLHSLRSTLASLMLENGTPLPVISEALGHQNINTTSIYLKIDMKGLRCCTIDPEEVSREK
ncbi:MAG: tyrosine-type recombinase/integrase [Actinobacteria bacterium]|nr:tyrosine-type recombinase/integrase [Actinomycetota bacterium]